MSVLAKQLLEQGKFDGGALVDLPKDWQQINLRQQHLAHNTAFVKPVLAQYPLRLPSVYLIADSLLCADEKLGFKLLLNKGAKEVTRHQKKEISCKEAMKIRRLCSLVRSLHRHNPTSYNENVDDLKKLVKKKHAGGDACEESPAKKHAGDDDGEEGPAVFSGMSDVDPAAPVAGEAADQSLDPVGKMEEETDTETVSVAGKAADQSVDPDEKMEEATDEDTVSVAGEAADQSLDPDESKSRIAFDLTASDSDSEHAEDAYLTSSRMAILEESLYCEALKVCIKSCTLDTLIADRLRYAIKI
jgi:hypothetical protein